MRSTTSPDHKLLRGSSPQGKPAAVWGVKWLIVLLLGLLLILQVKLWVGPGSMVEVLGLEQSITDQQAQNAYLRERNAALDAEVLDLKRGVEAIEERARSELGMIKQDETFFQIVDE